MRFTSWSTVKHTEIYTTPLSIYRAFLWRAVHSLFLWFIIFFNLGLALIFLALFNRGSLKILREPQRTILLAQRLVILSCLLFLEVNPLWILLRLELSALPVIFLTLGQGAQIEKINSVQYLALFRAPTGYSFLFRRLNLTEENETLFSLAPQEAPLTLGLSLIFLIKFPIFFLHVWLPKLHVEARTSASILLARLLLKLGVFGFLRILKLWETSNKESIILIFLLGCSLGSLITLAQRETKSLVAYRSVVHINLSFITTLTLENKGKTGTLEIALAHGYTSFALFFLVGETRHQLGNRVLYYLKGIRRSRLIWRNFIIIQLLLNGGLPPRCSFWAEVYSFRSLLPKTEFIIPFFLLLVFLGFLFNFNVILVIRGKSKTVIKKNQKRVALLILATLLNSLFVPLLLV